MQYLTHVGQSLHDSQERYDSLSEQVNELSSTVKDAISAKVAQDKILSASTTRLLTEKYARKGSST